MFIVTVCHKDSECRITIEYNKAADLLHNQHTTVVQFLYRAKICKKFDRKNDRKCHRQAITGKVK